MSHRTSAYIAMPIERDQMSPDSVKQLFSAAVDALEATSELRPLDWSELSVELTPVGLTALDRALVTQLRVEAPRL